MSQGPRFIYQDEVLIPNNLDPHSNWRDRSLGMTMTD